MSLKGKAEGQSSCTDQHAAEQRAAIRRTLEIFCAGRAQITLQTLDPVRTATVTSMDAAVTKALLFAGMKCQGVYLMFNEVAPDWTGKYPKDEDIVRRRWLVIDCDPDKAEDGGSATEDEKWQAEMLSWDARRFCEDAGLRSAVVGDSGNGFQIAYPIDLANDEAAKDLIKRILAGLKRACAVVNGLAEVDPKLYDAKRIGPCYGTMKRKGVDTAERPHRLTRILEGEPWSEETARANTEVLPQLVERLERRGRLIGFAVNDDDGPTVEERAIKYLAKMPPAISGSGGHNQTMEAARVVVFGFALGPEVGFRVLWEHYNPRCQPPWLEKELRHKCKEADEKPFGKPRGWLLASDKKHEGNGTAEPQQTTDSSQGHSAQNPQNPQRKRGFVRRAPYKPFPVDALPPILDEYVPAAAAAIGCDSAMVALPALAVVAAAIGNARVLRLRTLWTEPSVIWSAVLANSGEQKSPGWEAASRPYSDIQLEKIRDAKKQEKAYQAALQRGEKPEPPADAPTITTTDSTIWTLGELLRDNIKGILLSRDELDGWLQGFTRFANSKSTDRPHWLELNRAGTLLIDRMSRDQGRLAVPRAACSITGTIQPLILASSITDEDLAAGLLARILLANPPRRRKRWPTEDISAEQVKRYDRLLRALLDLHLQDDETRKPYSLDLDHDAKATWIDWYNDWADRQFESRAEQAAVLAKLEGYAARLGLIHHVVTLASEGCNELYPVSNRSIQAGIKLARWFANEAIRVYRILRLTQDEQDQRELVEWIESLGGKATTRDLRNSWRGRYPTVDDAETALNDLVEAGLGEWQHCTAGQQGGRPSRVFHLYAHKTPENSRDNGVSCAKDSEREPGEEG
jgi:hypothetical protein